MWKSNDAYSSLMEERFYQHVQRIPKHPFCYERLKNADGSTETVLIFPMKISVVQNKEKTLMLLDWLKKKKEEDLWTCDSRIIARDIPFYFAAQDDNRTTRGTQHLAILNNFCDRKKIKKCIDNNKQHNSVHLRVIGYRQHWNITKPEDMLSLMDELSKKAIVQLCKRFERYRTQESEETNVYMERVEVEPLKYNEERFELVANFWFYTYRMNHCSSANVLCFNFEHGCRSTPLVI
jgi:hypothetical protein